MEKRWRSRARRNSHFGAHIELKRALMSISQSGLVTAKPNHKIKLADIDPRAKGDFDDKDAGKAHARDLVKRIAKLQRALYAEHKQALLIVLQATDTGGKDGTIRHLLTGVNPQGVRVTSFGVPTPIEAAHDFLWRIHANTPALGMIGVFNRSHYEDVLVVRVHDLVPKKVWQTRYEAINNFEKLLTQSGTTVLKFYLHISKEEQQERLQSRLDNPDKNWKFKAADLKERESWDDYQAAYEDMINKCSTDWAPWNIVPADRKWARNIAIAEKVLATLEAMNPQYPKADFDASAVEIEG